MTLTGSYRSSLGILGEQLDRLVLHTVATATSTALLARIAAALKDAPARLLSRATCGSQARHLNPLPGDTPDSTGTGKP